MTPTGLMRTGLTKRRGRTTNGAMKMMEKRKVARAMVRKMMRTGALGAMAMPAMLGGCVSVNAPDKPIVINLNINITQQVVYRLDGQAKELIQGNPSIF